MNNQPYRNTRYRRSRREGYLGSPANWTGRAPRTYGWRELEDIADSQRERDDAHTFMHGLVWAMFLSVVIGFASYGMWRFVEWVMR